LKTDKDGSGFRFCFPGFPFLGIWAAKDADFVCIEPWCGIADDVNTTQEISQKEGIVRLESGALFERTWSVSIY
jgi:galactose mutarotase-like enzyme